MLFTRWFWNFCSYERCKYIAVTCTEPIGTIKLWCNYFALFCTVKYTRTHAYMHHGVIVIHKSTGVSSVTRRPCATFVFVLLFPFSKRTRITIIALSLGHSRPLRIVKSATSRWRKKRCGLCDSDQFDVIYFPRTQKFVRFVVHRLAPYVGPEIACLALANSCRNGKTPRSLFL